MVNQKLIKIINDAVKLHGHLGPYLVIGVKMGETAKKNLNTPESQHTSLRANVKVPLRTPFSCLLDGIQVSTTCTVGNQRLQIENSETIQALFTKQNETKTVKITLKPELIEQLKINHEEHTLTEKLALEIADTPENQLFNILLS